MRKGLALLLLIAVVAVAVVGVGAIGASASSPSGFEPWARDVVKANATATAEATHQQGRRLVLRTQVGQEKFVDADRSGDPSVGDHFIFTENFVNRQGKRIGRDWVTCTVHFQAGQCKGTFLLFGRGTIEVAGTVNERHGFIAITGGTGEFADVGGEVNVVQEGRLTLNLLHLAH